MIRSHRSLALLLAFTAIVSALPTSAQAQEARRRWERMCQIRAEKFDLVLPTVDRRGIVKAGLATVALLACFALPVPQATGVLVVAGALLVSRRRTTREMLAHVDWPLLLLFVGLFVITDAVAALPAVGEAVAGLQAAGFDPSRLGVMAPLTLAASNTIGNVPAVVLILALRPDLGAAALHALALLSTLAGNLLLVGSLANLIVAERAAGVGVRLGFRDHARCGVPMTLASMAVAVGWLLMVA